jgi:hypothetical protein
MLILVMQCLCLFDHLNNLKIFRMQIGAKFIFKFLPNFAFKNNLPKLGFDLKLTLNL